MSALKRFFKDTIIYGIAAVLPRAINILLVKLHTSKLTAEKYAVNTDYYVYAAYFNALLTYGMETAFFRFFSKEKEKGKVVSTSFLSLATTTFLFLVGMLIFSENISNFFGFKNPLFFKLLIWTTVLDTMVVIPYAYLRVTNRPIRFTLYKVLNILIFAFFNVFFLWFVPYAIQQNISLPESIVLSYQNNPKVIFIFIAGTIASASTFILLLPTFFKFKIQFDFDLLKKMLRYSTPILIAGLAYVTNENLDKLLLGDMVGEQQMGVYAACYKLGVFMTLFIMAFRLGAEPFFFNHSEEKNATTTYATILNWFVIAGAFFMIFIVAFLDVFASILLGSDEYFEALIIVPIILLANLLLGIYHNLAIWYKLTDKTRFGMYFSIIGALITIVFNVVMIPKIGFMASAWATLLAYGIMMLLSYFIGKKYYPVPYNISKTLSYLISAIVISFISFYYFRENYLVSVGLILIFGVIIYFNEKHELKAILKRK
ncbi:polysaccharide biosynthesis C-terminal domain-containing protein [Lutibacter sp. TH_r2]|uniref:MATE family efflux transporter n=1 Tax=Lutibacter sp. TH_r2 TaxID=3082083 RepID=UPI002952D1C4|nr:polysaccharide biosynthesis C-terminal domain-containing protein [Lutibacter sp. TH_r2]MDV7186582.1 polysaccharide biosynthesis C-terminal domain-containing protein [Lutibacter sp. TH_r2]